MWAARQSRWPLRVPALSKLLSKTTSKPWSSSSWRVCGERKEDSPPGKISSCWKETTGSSSFFSFARTGNTTVNSRRKWIVWIVRPELDIPNLNNVGDAHSWSSNVFADDRGNCTLLTKITLTSVLCTILPNQQVISSTLQVNNNISLETPTNLLWIKRRTGNAISSRNDCSIEHADPTTEKETPLCEVWPSQGIFHTSNFRPQIFSRNGRTIKAHNKRAEWTVGHLSDQSS